MSAPNHAPGTASRLRDAQQLVAATLPRVASLTMQVAAAPRASLRYRRLRAELDSAEAVLARARQSVARLKRGERRSESKAERFDVGISFGGRT